MANALHLRLPSIFWPSATPSLASFTLNASTDLAAWIFQAPEAATITKLGYRVATVTGTSPTYRVSLQGVDASAGPAVNNGTVLGGGSPASATFTQASTGWKWTTLDNSYTCARGDLMAMVIDYSSGTISGANCLAFTTGVSNVEGGRQRLPYVIHNDAGSATSQATWPVYAFGTASTVYGHPVANVGGGVTALKFTLPATWGSTFKLVGARIYTQENAGGSVVLTLYDGGGDSDTTVLQQVTLDGDASQGTGGASGVVEMYFDEATLSTLTYGNTYRLEVIGGNAIAGVLAASAADFDAYVLGQNAYGSDLSGTWTDYTDRRPHIELIFSDIAVPAGSSGPVGRTISVASIGTY